jgi:holo-[acyl-carrier protein] synthase
MIYGVGIDLVQIKRIKNAVEKWGDNFLNKVFTADEVAYCYQKKNPYLSLSVRFAAKEALIKAISSRVNAPLTDIEVVSSENGKPYIKVSGKLKKFFEDMSLKDALLSISHEKEYGIACVVLEK